MLYGWEGNRMLTESDGSQPLGLPLISPMPLISHAELSPSHLTLPKFHPNDEYYDAKWTESKQ